MLLVKANGVNITAKVDYNTIKITEQMNNRSGTCSFTVSDYNLPEGVIVEIWHGSELSQDEISAATTINVDDTFEYFQKYRVGDQLKIPAGTNGAITRTIQSINHTNKTITFTQSLGSGFSRQTPVGRLIFAGVSMKTPEDEIGRTGKMITRVQATDYTKIFDAKNVVDTWENVNAREIISGIVYNFTATDKSTTFSPCESLTGITASGVAVTPTLSSADKIYQNNSINIGASGAGAATYEFRAGDLAFDNTFAGNVNDADPAGWKAGSLTNISNMTSGGINNGRYLRITLTPGGAEEVKSHYTGYFGTGGFVMKPNTRYVVRGWERVTGTGTMQYGAKFGIYVSNAAGSSVGEYWTAAITSANGGWNYYEIAFTSAATAAFGHMGAIFYNHGTSTFTGTADFDEITASEAVDFSLMDKARLWIKAPAIPSSYISSATYKIVDKDNDSYTWTANVGAGGWGYDSGNFADATISGSVDLTQIVKFELTLNAIAAIPIGTFKVDHILATLGGFTTKSVEGGGVIFADIRSQYKKPTVLMEELAKLQNYYWYIDYEKDVHFFDQETNVCPMEVTDTSEVYGDLQITADISQLKNRQVVRGGEAVDASLYTQDEVTDGKQESWRLDYKPKSLSIYIDTTGTGSSYVLKTLGIENLDSAASFDYLFNFNEKIVKRASAPLLAAGTLVRRTYYPYRPIRVQVEDPTSITMMKTLLGGDGIYDGAVINDASIRDFKEARARGKAEIKEYSNPIITATFTSDQDGWKAGQILRIQDSNRGIDSDYVIQKLTRTQNTSGRWVYNITAGTTMNGLIEFFQLLLKRTENLLIDVTELVDIVKAVDETIIITDYFRPYKRQRPWYAHNYNQPFSAATIGTEGGTANDAYANYCEAN